jgi:hypothetical protein
VRKYQALEAGNPYQAATGNRTARLDEIVGQKDRALKQEVEQLSPGQVREAIKNLELGEFGYNRDGKRGNSQLSSALCLTPKASRWRCVFTGNTPDPVTRGELRQRAPCCRRL